MPHGQYWHDPSMTKPFFLAFVLLGLLTGCRPSSEPVTYYRDIAPIIQAHCQSCHRPGEVAPMALMTLDDVRLYSGAIRKAVLDRVMPPWFADPQHGHFAND
ncbi:MAG: hypothetical protein EBT06_12520, partial [Gammaproteobacteria bacterium]|nr:hypothetical protein [Gammaproteobacteria bacterium]